MDNSLIINKLKEYKNFTNDKQFADFLGIKPQTLSSWRSRDTLDFDLIANKFPDISMDWVLRKEGEMLKMKTDKLPLNKKAIPFNKIQNNVEEIGSLNTVEEKEPVTQLYMKIAP